MKKKYDSPLYLNKTASPDAAGLKEEIQHILSSESFAVLSTQGEGQAHSSLISFSSFDDLRKLVFSTPTQTRKYELISRSAQVSILVDTRCQSQGSINHIKAVTISGRARIIASGPESQEYEEILLSDYPNLESFIKAPTSSVIVVDVHHYHYVRSFQEVLEWDPNGI